MDAIKVKDENQMTGMLYFAFLNQISAEEDENYGKVSIDCHDNQAEDGGSRNTETRYEKPLQPSSPTLEDISGS